jgi:hypothetical protein
MQDEVKNRVDQVRVRGTVKAAKLEGDPGCPCLVASSVYDSKPVHYMSMVSSELKWVMKEKPVYNVDTGETEKMQFLRMNNINEYNDTMGNVDLADQLRGSYRLDHWVRNRKWWWSLFFWGIGVLLTNSYIVYNKVCDEEGLSRSDRLSHLEFRRSIASAWIQEKEFMEEQHHGTKRAHSAAAMPDISPVTFDSTSQAMSTSGDDERRKRKCARLSSMSSSSSYDGGSSMTRAVRVTDESLSESGKLTRIRLDRTMDHLPLPKVRGNSRCAIHRWVGIDTQKMIMFCPTCDVHLCIECFAPYHTNPNLVRSKQSLKNKYFKK